MATATRLLEILRAREGVECPVGIDHGLFVRRGGGQAELCFFHFDFGNYTGMARVKGRQLLEQMPERTWLALQYQIGKMNSSYVPRRQQTIIEKMVRLEYVSSPRQQMLKVNLQYITTTRQINFSKVMKDIASYGFPIENSQIFYWDYNRKMFVFVGNYPFKQDHFLKYQHFMEKVIHLRVKRIGKTSELPTRQEMLREPIASSAMEIEDSRDSNAKNEKRVKERPIHEVVDKVRLWRRVYDAVDNNGKKIHTLESAAREVGIAKKTLDDYFLYLAKADKHHFNFQANKNAGIGVLRTFVKEKQKTIKVEPQAPNLNQKPPSPPAASVKAETEPVAMMASSDEQSQAYLFHRDDSCESD